MEIIPNIHQVPGVTANAYLLVDPDGLALIDAGLPGSHKKILKYVEGLGYTPGDIKYILLTHADSDHVGGLAALQRASQAGVYTSEIEAEAITEGRFSRPLKLRGWRKWLFDFSRLFFKAAPCQVDDILHNGQSLEIMDKLQVLDTAGHTPGHLSFYLPQEKVLFCGDSLRTIDGQIQISSGANTWDEALAKQAAQKQAALDAKVICAGHGQVVHDAPAQIEKLSV
jgi:glyoxylase-like metal-dependent hydrolase (beta-lactamase superfamily II)